MSVIVSDTSPIRSLADEIALSSSLPQVVVSKIEFLSIRTPLFAHRVGELKRRVDAGEAEALALAEESPDSLLLIDELRGRAVASDLGLAVVGTVGILLEAKRRGLIAAVGPLLCRLRDENKFHLSDRLIRYALATVGENLDQASSGDLP
jgi:predicted nucleic acid-binding protein